MITPAHPASSVRRVSEAMTFKTIGIMKNPHWFYNDTYPIQYCFCSSEKGYLRAFKQLGVMPSEKLDSGASFYCCGNVGDKYTYIILMEASEHTVHQRLAMLAHEVMHLVQYIWQDIGEKIRGREAEAYLYQIIFQNIISIAFPNLNETISRSAA